MKWQSLVLSKKFIQYITTPSRHYEIHLQQVLEIKQSPDDGSFFVLLFLDLSDSDAVIFLIRNTFTPYACNKSVILKSPMFNSSSV
jgi:hypothetical protein